MRRINTTNKATDLFGPGKHGWKNGVPGTADRPTEGQAEWFNALQEEVCGVIEAAGVAIDPDNRTQLRDALNGLFANRLDLTNRVDATKGAGIPGFSYPLNYAPGSIGAKLKDWLSVKDEPFNAKGDGVTDDTVAVNAAIAYAAAHDMHLHFPNGTYLVSTLTTSYSSFTRAFHIDLGGSVIKSNGLSTEPLLNLFRARNVFVSNGALDLGRSLTQKVLVKIWSDDNDIGATYNTLSKITLRNAQYGVQVGDAARPDQKYTGENVMIGCNAVGVLNPAIVYGVQAELNIVASQMTASTEAWVDFPAGYVVNGITAVGGNIRMIGGEITSYVNNGICIRPMASLSGNLYGKVLVLGAWIEVQNRFAVAENPAAVAAPVGGVISLSSCFGSVVSDTQAAIDTAGDFKGQVRVKDCYLWANTTRTQPTINSSATTSVHVDSLSFSAYVGAVPPTAGFLSGPGAFTGGVVYYDSVAPQTALLVQQSAAQALPNGVWTKIELQNEAFDTANCFDPVTFRFKPTVAGYYQINVQLQVAASNAPCALDLYKNGASTGYTVGGFQNGVLNATASLSRVLFLNGTTDYVEAFGLQNSGGAVNTVTAITQLSAAYVRAG